jgi:hypothetical protein
MVDWKKLIRPIQEGQKGLATIFVRKVPAPEPTEEEFVSPLQQAIKDDLLIKGDIGYNETCVNCIRQRGIDARMLDTCESSTDPEPWLKELHGELVATREELVETRGQLAASERYHTPQNRMKWAAYGAFASGVTGVGLLIAKYATDWAITNLPQILPLILPFIG